MGFLLLLFAVTLFRIIKYLKLDYIVLKSVGNQVIFHIVEGVIFIYGLYLIENDGNILGLFIRIIFFYLLLFLPMSVYQVRYGDEDEKNNK